MEYPKELHENQNELPFLLKRMKTGKVEKLVRIKRDMKYTSKY